MLLAQITDTHVALPDSAMGRLGRTAEHLEAAVSHLLASSLKPDVVVITGDLVDEGKSEEYEMLAERLAALPMPVYLLPGNHDEREVLRSTLRERGHGYLPAQGFLQYTAWCGPVRLVALDTSVPGKPHGELCVTRLSWLRKTLAESDAMTLVLMHHPPFLTGLSRMDTMGLLAGCEELEQILGEAPHVERVLCGHLHRAITRRFGGTLASTCPSTAHQLELDLRAEGRLAAVREPPACQLHTLTRDGALVSHLSFIGDFGSPLVLAGD